MSYAAIADHGLIGDLQTAALVATDGTVDWFCCPRFDSPSVFASLLDHRRGDRFSIAAVGKDMVTRQMYLPDTAILVTRFLSPAGVAEVVDFMPVDGVGTAPGHRRLVRGVRGVRGEVEFDVRVEPRFNYGRTPHTTDVRGTRARFETAMLTLDLTASRPLERDGNDIHTRLRVRAGDEEVFLLECGAGDVSTVIDHGELQRLFDATSDFWQRWVECGRYRGRWREAVYRSAITLKLLTHAPTGALIAAPTAGLPEQIGGERNWDYRYTWVRDSAFSVSALLGLGFVEEVAAFAGWLRKRVEEKRADRSPALNIMYRVDGSSDLDEEVLKHLEGYRGSRPVRIGNGASGQLQLDIYGEVLDSVFLAESAGLGVSHAGWVAIAELLDWLCDNWNQPDEGIWETRGGRRAFVYGRLMSWVALDRAIKIANSRGRRLSPLDRRAQPHLPGDH